MYVLISPELELDIAAINAAHRQWGMGDYVSSFENQGNEDYHHLRTWAEGNNIPILPAACLLNGEVSDGGNVRNALIAGKFKAKDFGYANRVARIIAAAPVAAKWIRSSSFVAAISRVCRVPEFDDARLVAKMASHASFLTKQPDIPRYIEMIETIYNRQAKERVPLVFRVAEVMRERSAA
jgi:hypothetical protein